MKKILLLLLIAVSFSGCEKDDICDAATSTTPRLVIECYEFGAITPTDKSVNKLKAVASGQIDGVIFDSTLTDASKYLFNGKKILLPLKVTGISGVETTITYDLTLNFGEATANTDTLTIKYFQNNIYVSRACGYKTLFDLSSTDADILVPASDNWIKVIQIVKSNLENENEIHVKIYF
ncbi:DUF6452 family protein [Flavobacterium sp. SUN052]|uniref:DUF6452 family protein n=1 Tax=Flavobacterium sp. SUN052 TaxID=3002441 RepID=UPI00237E845D|nr:DUF6452 family protein [Flavobacterium sp. SUN052]MEC4003825.1 DUF6452 family protein [Flavobacterium sp. SUN052]